MPRLPRHTVYLLLSEKGEVHTGYTSNLCRRFREHNSMENTGWTRGRSWRLLAVRQFPDRDSALHVERELKTQRFHKWNWLRRLGRKRPPGRLRVLCQQMGIVHAAVRGGDEH